METYIVSFEINKPYDEWLTHFEQSRPGLEAADIAVCFEALERMMHPKFA